MVRYSRHAIPMRVSPIKALDVIENEMIPYFPLAYLKRDGKDFYRKPPKSPEGTWEDGFIDKILPYND